MESLSKPSQKVEKTKHATHHKKSAIIPMSLSPDPAPEPTDQPFIQGDDWFDFTLMDPMPDMTFDDLLQSDLDKPLETQQYVRNQWPWGDDPDFTTMVSDDFALQSEDLSFYNGQDLRDGPLFDHTHTESSALAFTTGNKKYPVRNHPDAWCTGSQRSALERAASQLSRTLLREVDSQRCCQLFRSLWRSLAVSCLRTLIRSC